MRVFVGRARTTVPINLVMGEKLPRLRLKTHPATAIFSQHLRITRNCRFFVPFLPSLCRRSVPGNPRAVHCLTPRTPCRERRNEMRKEERERERERERRGIIVMSNRKLTLNRGPSTVSFLLRWSRIRAEPRRKTRSPRNIRSPSPRIIRVESRNC